MENIDTILKGIWSTFMFFLKRLGLWKYEFGERGGGLKYVHKSH